MRIWNAAAEVITGLAERDVVNRPITDVVPGWAAVEEHVPVATGPGVPRTETVPIELGAESAGCRSPACHSRAARSTRSETSPRSGAWSA